MSKELSEMCPLGEKMAKTWLKLQENGEKKISNGESDGERKIYPSANPECSFGKNTATDG